MIYDELTIEFLNVARQFHKRDRRKGMNRNMQGEPMILACILFHGEDEPVTPGMISRETGITTARVAAALGTLEKKGLVCREMDPKDRRKIIIKVTEEGRNYAKERMDELKAFTKQMLEYLGEEDSREFIRILVKLEGWTPKGLCEERSVSEDTVKNHE